MILVLILRCDFVVYQGMISYIMFKIVRVSILMYDFGFDLEVINV